MQKKCSGYCNLLSWSICRDEGCNGDTGKRILSHALHCNLTSRQKELSSINLFCLPVFNVIIIILHHRSLISPAAKDHVPRIRVSTSVQTLRSSESVGLA
jgi:hypothetical protein